MPVTFDNIPDNIRVPLFYAEFDNSQSFNYDRQYSALAIGIKSGGSAPNETPQLITGGYDQAISLFGDGSQLSEIVRGFRRNDTFQELWATGVAEPTGVKANSTIVMNGTATESGVLTLYVGSEKVEAVVASGDNNSTVAAAMNAALAAKAGLAVTSSQSAGNITLTATSNGAYGNDIDLRLNYRGALGGEATPAGIGITVPAMANGTGNPDLTNAFAALGDEEYDFIILPHTDSTTLDDAETEMSDDTGRWSWQRQLYGHCFAAKRATVGNLTTLGNSRNEQHLSILGYADSPTSPWEAAGMLAGRIMGSLTSDPARPVQTLDLQGFMAPPKSSRFTLSERNTLLYDGISTLYYGRDGTARLDRLITTYQTNAFSQTDPSYLDVETLYTLAEITRRLKARITQKFPRHKLANDGTRFGPGQAIVTPRILKAELIAAYREMEFIGLVENADLFAQYLIVERNADNPNRIDVLLPPDLVNQLRVFALKNSFRLQYNPLTAGS